MVPTTTIILTGLRQELLTWLNSGPTGIIAASNTPPTNIGSTNPLSYTTITIAIIRATAKTNNLPWTWRLLLGILNGDTCRLTIEDHRTSGYTTTYQLADPNLLTKLKQHITKTIKLP